MFLIYLIQGAIWGTIAFLTWLCFGQVAAGVVVAVAMALLILSDDVKSRDEQED
jgi:hypothetical protein